MSKEELKQVHGYHIPLKGEKVQFMNLGKLCPATGDGVHNCYQLVGHHPKPGEKPKAPAKPKPPKKTATKKKTTTKKKDK